MSVTTEAPDWITPGTPALVIAGRDGCHVTEVSIAKVYKRYFTVNGHPYGNERFRLDPSDDAFRGFLGTGPCGSA